MRTARRRFDPAKGSHGLDLYPGGPRGPAAGPAHPRREPAGQQRDAAAQGARCPAGRREGERERLLRLPATERKSYPSGPRPSRGRHQHGDAAKRSKTGRRPSPSLRVRSAPELRGRRPRRRQGLGVVCSLPRPRSVGGPRGPSASRPRRRRSFSSKERSFRRRASYVRRPPCASVVPADHPRRRGRGVAARFLRRRSPFVGEPHTSAPRADQRRRRGVAAGISPRRRRGVPEAPPRRPADIPVPPVGGAKLVLGGAAVLSNDVAQGTPTSRHPQGPRRARNESQKRTVPRSRTRRSGRNRPGTSGRRRCQRRSSRRRPGRFPNVAAPSRQRGRRGGSRRRPRGATWIILRGPAPDARRGRRSDGL